MKSLLPPRGPRNQQVDLALAQFLDLMFTRIGQLHVQLNAGIFLGKSPHDRRHQAVQDDVRASQPHLAGVRIGQMFERAKALLHLVEDIDAASKQYFAMGREFSAP